MSTAGSVPVFSGRRSLSLGDLDAMGNVVRDTANTLRAVGRTGRTGYAHASNAWYVPEPVPGVGEKKDFTAEAPGLIAGAEFSGQFKRCIIEDGMLWLPHAHMESAVDEETGEELVTRHAGGVVGIEVREDSAATLEDGVIVLPLAKSAKMEEDSSTGAQYPLEDARAGLLQEVQVDPFVTEPELDEGVLRLPLAAYDSAAGIFGRAGLITAVDMVNDSNSATIRQGVLRIPISSQTGVPLAEYNSGNPATPGIIAGVEWTGDATPSIKAGVLRIPVSGGGGGGTPLTDCVVEKTTDEAGEVDGSVLRLNLAEYDSAAGTPAKAGLVKSIAMTSGGAPRIDDGCIVVPTHSFDPQHFNVGDGGLVSLLQAPVGGLAGLYDAENNRRLTWEELKASSLVRLSYSSSSSLGVSVKMFDDYLALYVDRP